MSEAEHPDRARPDREVTLEDVRQLMGASTPHFALQLRNRIARLVEGLPAAHPARREGEPRSPASSGSATAARSAATRPRRASPRCPRSPRRPDPSPRATCTADPARRGRPRRRAPPCEASRHGPDLHREPARVPRRAARLAGRQPARRPSPRARTPATRGGATGSAGCNDGGWAGVHWPTEYGGRGASLMETAIFFEELGRARAPLPANVLGLLLAGPTIMVWGTDEQKERYLRADPVGRGDLVPGLLRARRRLGPRRAEDPRGQGRRRLGRHRPEGVDLGRAVLEVVHARRAHRRRGGQAQGPHLLPDGHGAGRRPGAPAAPDHRRPGVQRAVHRGGPRPARERRSAARATAGRSR